MNKHVLQVWPHIVNVCVLCVLWSSHGSSMAPMRVEPSVMFSQKNTHHGAGDMQPFTNTRRPLRGTPPQEPSTHPRHLKD